MKRESKQGRVYPHEQVVGIKRKKRRGEPTSRRKGMKIGYPYCKLQIRLISDRAVESGGVELDRPSAPRLARKSESSCSKIFVCPGTHLK